MTPYEIHEHLMADIEQNIGVTDILGMPDRIQIAEENTIGAPAGEYKQENGIWVLVDPGDERFPAPSNQTKVYMRRSSRRPNEQG